MPKITPLPCREIERRLKVIGFRLDHVDGAIRFYVRMSGSEVFIVQVHFHSGDKDPETIRSIMRTGGISREEWLGA